MLWIGRCALAGQPSSILLLAPYSGPWAHTDYTKMCMSMTMCVAKSIPIAMYDVTVARALGGADSPPPKPIVALGTRHSHPNTCTIAAVYTQPASQSHTHNATGSSFGEERANGNVAGASTQSISDTAHARIVHSLRLSHTLACFRTQ